MLRNLGIDALRHVALVFVTKRVEIIFAVTGNKEFATVFIRHEVNACLVGFGKDKQVVLFLDVLADNARIARMGSRKLAVEATNKGIFGDKGVMSENARNLLVKRDFIDTVIDIKTCVSAQQTYMVE